MEYPISLSSFQNFYRSLALKEYYSKELTKLEKYSIKKNFDDYSFFASIEFDSISDQDDYFSSYIRKFFEKNESTFYHIINKIVFLYDENPYFFVFPKTNVLFVKLCCYYIFVEKIINIKSIVDFNFLNFNFPNSKILNYRLLIKNSFSKELDVKIQKLQLLSEDLNVSTFTLRNEIYNILGTSYFDIFPKIESDQDKIQKYFVSRKLREEK